LRRKEFKGIVVVEVSVVAIKFRPIVIIKPMKPRRVIALIIVIHQSFPQVAFVFYDLN